MSHLPDEKSFLKDVATHEMTVLRDDDLYRHLRFSRPNTCNMYFNITTWPGYLAITGDMGDYVFSRLPDMFEFFRNDTTKDGSLHINPGYWGEKVRAVDRNSPIKKYSPKIFIDAVCRWADEREASQEIRAAVVDEVISRAHDGEHSAMAAAMEFEHDGFRFDDFWEVSTKEIGYHFLWACYAIAWAVREYDRSKESQQELKVG